MKLGWIVSFVSVEMERRRLQPSLLQWELTSYLFLKPLIMIFGARTSLFGFDSAVSIATDAIDRLHSTASSHKKGDGD